MAKFNVYVNCSIYNLRPWRRLSSATRTSQVSRGTENTVILLVMSFICVPSTHDLTDKFFFLVRDQLGFFDISKMLDFDSVFCSVMEINSNKKGNLLQFTPMRLGFSSTCEISDKKKKHVMTD